MVMVRDPWNLEPIRNFRIHLLLASGYQWSSKQQGPINATCYMTDLSTGP